MNNDGLLSDIPSHLLTSKGQRSLKLSLLSKEERNQLKLMKADEKLKKTVEAKARIENDILRQRERERDIKQQRDHFDMTEMRAELEKQVQLNAEKFV